MTGSTGGSGNSEIEDLVNMIKANPFPEGLVDARAAMDSLGTPIAGDVARDDIEIDGVRCRMLVPLNADRDRVIVYLHGGGYALGSLDSHGGLAAEIGRAAASCVLQVDYRLAPEHTFPAPIEDACRVYRGLLAQGYQADKLSLAGDSAGGGLVIATLLALRQEHESMPGAAVCLSPWVDLEFTGASIQACRDVDPILKLEVLSSLANAYLAGQDPHVPGASPLQGDLRGLPPLLIQVGENELLLSDAERLAEKARTAKLDLVFEKWPEMIHVWHLFYPQLKEGRSAIARVGDFIREKTG